MSPLLRSVDSCDWAMWMPWTSVYKDQLKSREGKFLNCLCGKLTPVVTCGAPKTRHIRRSSWATSNAVLLFMGRKKWNFDILHNA